MVQWYVKGKDLVAIVRTNPVQIKKLTLAKDQSPQRLLALNFQSDNTRQYVFEESSEDALVTGPLKDREDRLREERRQNDEENKKQQEENQQKLIAGIRIDSKTTDVSGPEATEWFAKDILAQIQLRLNWKNISNKKADNSRLGGFPSESGGAQCAAGLMALFDDSFPWLREYKEGDKDPGYFIQVKYLMAPKWMDFGGPATGKGVNTVVIAGRILRKNQLGNIEFGVITNLVPPFGLSADYAIKVGYELGDVYGKNKHPWGWNTGFHGLNRVDNLAAFGVGAEIADRIASLSSWKENQSPTLKEIVQILHEVLGDNDVLKKAVNRYKDLYPHAPSGMVIGIDALTTIETFGGFNTESLKVPPKDAKPFEGPTSIDYFRDVVYKAYSAYRDEQKEAGKEALSLDDWLRYYRENYTDAKGRPSKSQLK